MTAQNDDFTHRDGVELAKYIDEMNASQCAKHNVCRRAIDDKFITAKDATDLARMVVNEKLGVVEERIAILIDMNNSSIKRVEYAEAHKRLEDKLITAEHNLKEQVDQLRLNEAKLLGRASQKSVMWAYAIAFMGVALSLAGVVIAVVLH
jgi:hypothetical protein